MRAKIADNGKVLIEMDQAEAKRVMDMVQNPIGPAHDPDDLLRCNLFTVLRALWPVPVNYQWHDPTDDIPY